MIVAVLNESHILLVHVSRGRVDSFHICLLSVEVTSFFTQHLHGISSLILFTVQGVDSRVWEFDSPP